MDEKTAEICARLGSDVALIYGMGALLRANPKAAAFLRDALRDQIATMPEDTEVARAIRARTQRVVGTWLEALETPLEQD